MRLQLAIDHGKEHEILAVVERVAPEVDIVEIGFPMIVTYGLGLVEKIRELVPSKPLCVDVKVFHGGTGVASRCFDAGANIVSVLSVAPDPVIEKLVAKAKTYDGEILCDMSAPARMVAQRTAEVDQLGVDYIMVPTGFKPDYDYDIDKPRRWSFRPKVRPLDLAGVVTRNAQHAKLALSTGIDQTNIRQVIDMNPELIIVGRAILDQSDNDARAAAAAHLRRFLPYEG
ncbi:MAG: orotidine 5'-phosphate decarboxylase [Atopobiaceae bacterium]|nr:orotidine 5'-phosphate decarboxylase [Atopobiaceae bacterium]